AQVPRDLAGSGAISPETHRWLGRAAVLIAETVGKLDAHGSMDLIKFNQAADGLTGILRDDHAHEIVTVLHRALARAEKNAPAAAQGAFIPVGAVFDVFQVVRKVLGEAKSDLLIVDAYMGANVLTDFAPLAREGVTIRLLTDGGYTKPDALKPAATRWAEQYAAARPLEIRLTAPRQLHDRLIAADREHVWSLTQSLKDFAARSPATVLRVEREIAQQKIHAYGALWEDAKLL